MSNDKPKNVLPSSPGSDEKIHIALSIWDLTDTYNRHASVTMISILENTNSAVCFHLLYDKRNSDTNPALADKNMQRYLEIGTKYNADILFHHVEVPRSALQNKLIQIYTPGSLLRFFIPELIPDAKKVIYLDTDIVVTLDIQELWDVDVNGADVAAVVHSDRGMAARYDRKIGINPKIQFNSGVMIFNVSQIQKKYNLSDTAFQMMADNPTYQLPDQNVLNLLFQKTLCPLPQKYNCNPRSLPNVAPGGAVIHFAGRLKPWHAYDGAAKYYWHYLLLSPWAAKSEDLMQYLLDAPSPEKSLAMYPGWLKQKYPRELLPYLWKLAFGIPCSVLWWDLRYLILFRILGKNPA